MMRLPNGEQLHLFLVRPLGARRLGDPRHDG
jgi:hypothetical protein